MRITRITMQGMRSPIPHPVAPDELPAEAPRAHTPPEPYAPTTVPRWASAQLLGDGPLAEISHGDQIYRLRLTALGKLILTK
jgi:hemin uptake protein HemP